MVYINGKPFCVKDRDAPFQNLEQPGITASGVREREHLLKYEVPRPSLARLCLFCAHGRLSAPP